MISGIEECTPPYLLTGSVVNTKWTVGERLEKKEGDSGGFFSVGYRCRSDTGSEAFLKAIDLYKLYTNSDDFVRDSSNAFQGIQGERDLLEECKRMDRVVSAIDYGEIYYNSDGEKLIYPIPFIIFELANSTARREIFSDNSKGVSWSLRVLHQATVGVYQMHRKMISHQDIKLSNILVFDKNVAKISDLGRSVQQGRTLPHDVYDWPGDKSYTPPEIAYGYKHSEFNVRRLAADMYLLGSNACCIFTKTPLNALLYNSLPRSFWPAAFGGSFDGTFTDVLPHLINSFEQVLSYVKGSMAADAPYRDEIIEIIREWSWPDPHGRGSPLTRSIMAGSSNIYSLERYLSKLDRLARAADFYERRMSK